MSLAIDSDSVTRVLLADGWHDVLEGTFNIDAYEFMYCGDGVLHGGGASGICPSGFEFRTAGGVVLSGPLTSVLAVEHPVSKT